MGMCLPKLQGLRGKGIIVCCIQDVLRYSSFDGHTCRQADSVTGLHPRVDSLQCTGKGGLTKAAEHGGKCSVDHPCRYRGRQLAAAFNLVVVRWRACGNIARSSLNRESYTASSMCLKQKP